MILTEKPRLTDLSYYPENLDMNGSETWRIISLGKWTDTNALLQYFTLEELATQCPSVLLEKEPTTQAEKKILVTFLTHKIKTLDNNLLVAWQGINMQMKRREELVFQCLRLLS